MTKYSKRMVIVHWLTLALLSVAWLLGENLSEATEDGKATLVGYIIHAAVGVAILLLTMMRLFFRSRDGTPPAMGRTALDKVAKGIHQALYTVLFLLPVSGVVTVFSSAAGKALLSGDVNLLPKGRDFKDVLSSEVHEQLVGVLIFLVVIHLLGALKHQFITKDGLMERMMLRRKD